MREEKIEGIIDFSFMGKIVIQKNHFRGKCRH